MSAMKWRGQEHPWVVSLPPDHYAGRIRDVESPSDWMCRLACGDTDAARQQRVRQGVLDAAARWLL